MSGTQVGGLAIQIIDARGDLISRNARGGVNIMSISLNAADIKVAHAMGIDPKAVAMLKYKHGAGGLANVALLGADTTASPFAPAKPDNDDEMDPTMGISFPNGETSRSKKRNAGGKR
jgi:hypothetical protein